MLTNRNIVVFSDDWGRHPSSCQHLIKQLLLRNRVVWVNTIGMRSPRLSLYDIKRSVQILVKWLTRQRNINSEQFDDNLTVVSPVIIPYNQVPFVRRINRSLVKRKLLNLLHREGMTDLIVLTTFPCTCDYVGFLEERLHIYYCVDDFVNWPDVNLRLIREMELTLLEQCDLALATSEELCSTKAIMGKKPKLLSHGVDFDRFNACVEFDYIPEEFGRISKPIIGFFGALSAWLDFDLIADLAKARPDWSFVFIGPVDTDISSISNYKNIYLIGKIPYEHLPRYASCFDVGIIPFQVNDLTRSVNPLKLLEYLSLGIPVVSTYMPEIMKYSDVVTVVHNSDEFLAALENSLAYNTSDMRQQRLVKAKSNSWKAVAERFSQFVADAELTFHARARQ